MNVLLLVISMLIVLSCKKQDGNAMMALENETIEVYNFSELENLLHTNDDRTYVVNFWATWCKPCVEEMPYFQELHDTYSGKNLKVLLVSLDLPADLHTKLKPFVEKYKLTAQVVLLDDPDENKWIPKVDESWSGALPATLIYNKNKRAFYERTFTKETLFNEINNF